MGAKWCAFSLNKLKGQSVHLPKKYTNFWLFYLQGDEALSVYLEYVSGGSIHKLLQEYGPFEEPVIRNYTRQIVSGLAYLHGRNVVHRYRHVSVVAPFHLISFYVKSGLYSL